MQQRASVKPGCVALMVCALITAGWILFLIAIAYWRARHG
jgi:hypothetical protein